VNNHGAITSFFGFSPVGGVIPIGSDDNIIFWVYVILLINSFCLVAILF